MDRPRGIIVRAWTGILHLFFRLSRGLTIGVRAVVRTDDGKFLLVRHTYISGWHFPGGGVEPGQTIEEALAHELSQETGLKLLGKPKLHGIFFNRKVSKFDHVLVFLCEVEGAIAEPSSSLEIAELGFFGLNELPNEIDQGTQRRLHEIVEGTKQSNYW